MVASAPQPAAHLRLLWPCKSASGLSLACCRAAACRALQDEGSMCTRHSANLAPVGMATAIHDLRTVLCCVTDPHRASLVFSLPGTFVSASKITHQSSGASMPACNSTACWNVSRRVGVTTMRGASWASVCGLTLALWRHRVERIAWSCRTSARSSCRKASSVVAASSTVCLLQSAATARCRGSDSCTLAA